MPTMTGKAVAFITRPTRGGHGLELLVWSHPMAGVQLPAGSLFDGEDPLTGASREAWEETGLGDGPDLELVGAVGDWVEPETGLTRHAFHYRCVRETPAEWWVITPDGHGLCWRCWWTPLDGTEPVHPAQRRWLDRVRHRLDDDDHRRPLRPLPALPRPYDDPGTEYLFVAPPLAGRWFAGVWVPGAAPPPDPVVCVHSVCVDEAGQAVVIAEEAVDQQGDVFHPWAPAGGALESGETIDAALAREVDEEACATVVASEVLGFVRVAIIDDAGQFERDEWQARAWSRVRLDPWEPRFETVARRLVPVADLVSELPYWRHPLNERWFTAALAHERSITTPA